MLRAQSRQTPEESTRYVKKQRAVEVRRTRRVILKAYIDIKTIALFGNREGLRNKKLILLLGEGDGLPIPNSSKPERLGGLLDPDYLGLAWGSPIAPLFDQNLCPYDNS